MEASKLCPMTIAVLLMASIWLIIAENVWYSVSVMPWVVFSVAIIVRDQRQHLVRGRGGALDVLVRT